VKTNPGSLHLAALDSGTVTWRRPSAWTHFGVRYWVGMQYLGDHFPGDHGSEMIDVIGPVGHQRRFLHIRGYYDIV
jgi:hypothetical protein